MSNPRSRRATARSRTKPIAQRDHSTLRAAAHGDYRVSSTWNDSISVSDRELEVIELYLGEAIDRLLAHRPRARGPPD